MKKRFVFLGLWLLCQNIAIENIFAEQVLNLVTLDNFAPFTWNENGENRGIDVDIVKELCRRSGIRCNIKLVPWKRVINYVETGHSDGGFAGFRTSEREKFADFLEYPIHYLDYAIFVRKGHKFQFMKIEDIYGKKFGKNRGFVINQEFDTAVSTGKIKIEEADNSEQNILKLHAGRFDGYLCDPKEALFAAKKLGLSDKIEYLPYFFQEQKGAYLMISKTANITNKMLLIDKMNKSLKSMYDDGTIEQINANYLK